MDRRIERRLRLQIEPEHKNLYSWAIQELDESGKRIGRDLIPWVWRTYFTATEIFLSESLEVNELNLSGRRAQKAEVVHRREITAKLRVGEGQLNRYERPTTYRMFGTDRTIKKFSLRILALETEEEKEECLATGGVAFETFGDYVEFNLIVKPSTFERYATRIAEGSADEVILGVGFVEGFYADWSPDVVTDEIKVLARGSEQTVELPDGVSQELPRLGKLGNVALHIHTRRVQAKLLLQAETTTSEGDEQQNAPLVRLEIAEGRLGAADPRIVKLLGSLKMSARWIVGLLVLIAVILIMKR